MAQISMKSEDHILSVNHSTPNQESAKDSISAPVPLMHKVPASFQHFFCGH